MTLGERACPGWRCVRGHECWLCWPYREQARSHRVLCVHMACGTPRTVGARLAELLRRPYLLLPIARFIPDACGSGLARDGLEHTALVLDFRVIVDVHRGQARSHRNTPTRKAGRPVGRLARPYHSGRPAGRRALAFDLDLPAPSAGTVARGRTSGDRALGYLGPGGVPLFQVTRRKGGTLSSHHRSNGYAHHPL